MFDLIWYKEKSFNFADSNNLNEFLEKENPFKLNGFRYKACVSKFLLFFKLKKYPKKYIILRYKYAFKVFVLYNNSSTKECLGNFDTLEEAKEHCSSHLKKGVF